MPRSGGLRLTVECIHGLAAGLCDQCFPKPTTDKQAGAPASTVRPRVIRKLATQRRTAPMTADKPAVVDAGAKRIFHVTHVRNLSSIVSSGRLFADAAGAAPIVDISSPENREQRRATDVGAGGTVANYVPFFLAPNAYVWDELRAQAADDRLSPDVRRTPASDFVVLVSTVRAAGQKAVIADRDAADPLTRFTALAGLAELGERLPRRLGDENAELAAEFLVRDSFPFDQVTLISVANDKARGEVRAILQSSAFSPKIAVYPPWFQRA